MRQTVENGEINVMNNTYVNDGGGGNARRVMSDFNYNIDHTKAFCRHIETLVSELSSQQDTVRDQILVLYQEDWTGSAADAHQRNLLDWYYQGQLKIDRMNFFREQLEANNAHAIEVLQIGLRLYIDPEKASTAVYVDGGYFGMNYTVEPEVLKLISQATESVGDAVDRLKGVGMLIPSESSGGFFSEDMAQGMANKLVEDLTQSFLELDSYRSSREFMMNMIYEFENATIERMAQQPPLTPNMNKLLASTPPAFSVAMMGRMTELLLQEEDDEVARKLVAELNVQEEVIRRMIKDGELDEDQYIGVYGSLKIPITYNGVICNVEIPLLGSNSYLSGLRQRHKSLVDGNTQSLYRVSEPKDGEMPTIGNVMSNRYRITAEGDMEALAWWNDHKIDGATWDDFAGYEYAFEGTPISDIDAMLLAGGIEDYKLHKEDFDDGDDTNNPTVKNWILDDIRIANDGLVMELYRNTVTGEVTVSVRASSDFRRRVDKDGLFEFNEAVKITEEWIKGNKNISFVGLDRGAAIAQLLALKYNQPATVFNSSLTAEQIFEAGLMPQAITNKINEDDTKIIVYYVDGSLASVLGTGTVLGLDDDPIKLDGKSVWKGAIESANPLNDPSALIVEGGGLGLGVIADAQNGMLTRKAFLKRLGVWGIIAGSGIEGFNGAIDSIDKNTKREQLFESIVSLWGLDAKERRELKWFWNKYIEDDE
jgi:hypothetical protein